MPIIRAKLSNSALATSALCRIIGQESREMSPDTCWLRVLAELKLGLPDCQALVHLI